MSHMQRPPRTPQIVNSTVSWCVLGIELAQQ